MLWGAAAVCVLLCFLPACRGATELPDGLRADRRALMSLQNAVSAHGFGLSRISSWKALGNPCLPKPWNHVTCGGGRVIGLTLSSLKVQGTLPPEFKLATQLVWLNLEGNKFTGTIPEEWADPAYFTKLETLNLQGNLLRGTLPNRRWNRLNAFPSLRTLDLSGNYLYGGLPDGWLASARVFKRLEYLDLSQNYLGYATAPERDQFSTSYSATGNNFWGGTYDHWRLDGVAVGSEHTGWCGQNGASAGTPLSGTMAALRFLDLSSNGLKGFLPPNWGRMFPKLQNFLIHDNSFYTTTADTPAVLPIEWTRRVAPRAFISLENLVLYPGNEYICALPDGSTNGEGYVDVNGASSFNVLYAGDESIDNSNPWICPGPVTDIAPVNVGLDTSGSTLVVTFDGADNTAPFLFGFKVTLSTYNADTGISSGVAGWTGTLAQTWGADLAAAGSTLTVDTSVAGTWSYTLDTGLATADNPGTYSVEVAALGTDGRLSSAGATPSDVTVP